MTKRSWWHVWGLAPVALALLVLQPASAAVPTAPEAERAPGWSRPDVVWSAPSRMGPPRSLTQAIDSRGTVTAAWAVRSGATARFMASRLGRRGWTKPKLIGTAPWDTYGRTNLSVTVGPTDEVVVVWGTTRANSLTLGLARFSGRGWEPARTIFRSPNTNLWALAAAADSGGVSVLWQVTPTATTSGAIRAVSFPSSARVPSAVTVLDDTAWYQPSLQVVRDAAASVRAVWVHGTDMVSVAGGTGGWGGARETVAASPADASAAMLASALQDGTVVVVWFDPNAEGGAGAVLSSYRSANGWSPPGLVLPADGWSYPRLEAVILGPSPGVTVVLDHTNPKANPIREVVVWDGAEWRSHVQAFDAPVQRLGVPVVVPGELVTVDLLGNCFYAVCNRATKSWLTSSTLLDQAWTPAARLTGAGLIGGFSGAVAPDGTYWVVYGAKPTTRTAGVWSIRYSGGAWSTPQVVAARARSRASSVPANVVVGTDGTVTTIWTSGQRILSSRTR